MAEARRRRPWWQWVLGAFAGLLILSALFGSDDKKPARAASTRTAPAPATAGATATTGPKAPGTRVASSAAKAPAAMRQAANVRAAARQAAKARAAARALHRRQAAKARAAVRKAARDKAASACDPSYAGACLNPSSADYDCEGGSGNGPDYTGTVSVVGDDHFDLDRDGDGTGCE